MFLYPKLFPRDIHETGLRKLCTSRHLLGDREAYFQGYRPSLPQPQGPCTSFDGWRGHGLPVRLTQVPNARGSWKARNGTGTQRVPWSG